MEKRENFGRFGALMAMAGSAVGLGNLWRFPYLLGENGGAAFLLVYIACAFLIALPIFVSEFIVGRRSGANCFGAFSVLAPGSKWKWIGIFGVITPMIIVSFYSVIGGWSVEYLFKACTFQFSGEATQEELSRVFADFSTSVWAPLFGHTLFLGTTAFVVMRGVKQGIESFGKVAMPVLFFIVLAMAIYILFQPGAMAGYSYLFKPDFSKISFDTVSVALGQAFFSMSLGCGCILTYSSYVRKKDNLLRHCVSTTVLDMLFAIIAGCAIMPAVFAYGLNPAAGPSLVYETLPFIFSKMPLSNTIAIVFFVALLVAALTSQISMFEVGVAFLMEERKLSRKKASAIIFALTWVAGSICCLSFGPLNDVRVGGKTIFDLFDFISSDYLMTLGALCTVLFVGWRLGKSDVYDEFTSGAMQPTTAKWFPLFYFLIRYIAPLAIIFIFVSGTLL